MEYKSPPHNMKQGEGEEEIFKNLLSGGKGKKEVGYLERAEQIQGFKRTFQ